MRRILYLFTAALAFIGIACPPGPSPDVLKKKTGPAVIEKPAPQPELPAHLKPRLDAVIEHVANRDLRTDNAFWTIFHGILGTGLENTMLRNPKTDEKVNAIEYICNGGEVRGMQFIPTRDGLDVQMGPQFVGQGHQDQFIAEMAQWGMPRDKKFLIGGKEFTFEDFIRKSRARASITQQQELSWAIIIIGQYYGTNHSWTNSEGEKLRYEDVVRYEVDQPINMAACGGTHRLFGLTWAYHLHLKNGGRTEGVWKDLADKLQEHIDLAKKYQNKDGSLSTEYFKGPGKKRDPNLQISTTGHTVEWLALALSDEELRAPWMENAVQALIVMILNLREEVIDGGALYHATHGLHLYRDRVFGTPPRYLPLPPLKK